MDSRRGGRVDIGLRRKTLRVNVQLCKFGAPGKESSNDCVPVIRLVTLLVFFFFPGTGRSRTAVSARPTGTIKGYRVPHSLAQSFPAI